MCFCVFFVFLSGTVSPRCSVLANINGTDIYKDRKDYHYVRIGFLQRMKSFIHSFIHSFTHDLSVSGHISHVLERCIRIFTKESVVVFTYTYYKKYKISMNINAFLWCIYIYIREEICPWSTFHSNSDEHGTRECLDEICPVSVPFSDQWAWGREDLQDSFAHLLRQHRVLQDQAHRSSTFKNWLILAHQVLASQGGSHSPSNQYQKPNQLMYFIYLLLFLTCIQSTLQ